MSAGRPDIGQALASTLDEQCAYYAARASEYDEWYLRHGRYDQGPARNRRWFAELREVEERLERFAPRGRILELAAGTGLWTRHLERWGEVVAVDASAEMLAINRQRNGDAVRYTVADLFEWQPAEQFDVCFFGFWLTHVPDALFEPFWAQVAATLEPNGRVFLVDSLPSSASAAQDEWLEAFGSQTMRRRLNDGSEFQIVKRYWRPEDLADRLANLGWDMNVGGTDTHFLIGEGAPVANERTSDGHD